MFLSAIHTSFLVKCLQTNQICQKYLKEKVFQLKEHPFSSPIFSMGCDLARPLSGQRGHLHVPPPKSECFMSANLGGQTWLQAPQDAGTSSGSQLQGALTMAAFPEMSPWSQSVLKTCGWGIKVYWGRGWDWVSLILNCVSCSRTLKSGPDPGAPQTA